MQMIYLAVVRAETNALVRCREPAASAEIFGELIQGIPRFELPNVQSSYMRNEQQQISTNSMEGTLKDDFHKCTALGSPQP